MLSRLSFFVPLAMMAAFAGAPADSYAGVCSVHAPCTPVCGGVHYVPRTVYKPQWVMQTRRVMTTQYVYEQREVTETVYRCIPETTQVERRTTVMVPQTRTKTVPVTVYRPVSRAIEREYQVQVPVWTQEEREYTVMVPEVETRTGVRHVAHCVEEEVPQTVCRDEGHWEVQKVQVPCCPVRRPRLRRVSHVAACCHTPQVVQQKVWVPNVVEEEVMVTVSRQEIVEEPYEYEVTVYRPETRTKMVDVCEMRTEVRKVACQVTEYQPVREERQVTYTEFVPTEKSWVENVTHYRQVAQEVKRMVTVCVPKQVECEVPIRVRQMVPHTVHVPVRTVHCAKPHCL